MKARAITAPRSWQQSWQHVVARSSRSTAVAAERRQQRGARARRNRARDRRARPGSPPPGRRRPAAGRASRPERERRVGARRRRGHEHAAVGQRLERRDPEVLAPRRGDEHPGAAQERAELVGRQRPGELRRPRVGASSASMPATTSVSPPRRARAHASRTTSSRRLTGIAGVGDRSDVARGLGRRGRGLDRRRARRSSGVAWPLGSGSSDAVAPWRAPAAPAASRRRSTGALPDPVAAGPVLGRDRVEPDRPRRAATAAPR